MLLILGFLALAGLMWLGRTGRLPWGLDPRRLAAWAALAAAGVLAARGNLLAALLVSAGGIWLGEGWAGLRRRLRSLRAGGAAPPRTSLVEMLADDGGNALDGYLRAGRYAGRRLSEVPPTELAEEVVVWRGADPEGSRLLEVYLDRRHAGWREHAQGDPDSRPGRPPQPGTMTEQEAYQILGLERGASLEQVRAAHRALMKRLHPDQGGSVEQAARVNAARDRLMSRHR